MSRSSALLIGIIALFAIVLVSVVLVVSFHGNDTEILVSAIIGFSAPTILGMFTLLQGSINGEKADAAARLVQANNTAVQETRQRITETAATVDAVNKKVNGHLARLTQTVIDAAASGGAIDNATIAQLAQKTQELTGTPMTGVPSEQSTLIATGPAMEVAALTSKPVEAAPDTSKGAAQ